MGEQRQSKVLLLHCRSDTQDVGDQSFGYPVGLAHIASYLRRTQAERAVVTGIDISSRMIEIATAHMVEQADL